MAEKTEKRRVGDLGEDIAARFLVKQGFSIVERNFWKPFGEIDIIAKSGSVLHFVEVKTVSRITSLRDGYRPEDNIHAAKLKRIGRTLQAYLFEQKMDPEWVFDVITVELDHEEKTAKVHFLKNLILPGE